uniref:Uncharacterized protein n=1 Tax=Phaseolus vulgaris TaxID=3885 RepID=V7CNN0_PHAVU|nr:hypothetical protein PHAVU_002G198000g [Phaseolus vulgaris]ESW30973.1 hypothetical protein PHAVU_002G198000g [Phaseolus vulgaris]
MCLIEFLTHSNKFFRCLERCLRGKYLYSYVFFFGLICLNPFHFYFRKRLCCLQFSGHYECYEEHWEANEHNPSKCCSVPGITLTKCFIQISGICVGTEVIPMEFEVRSSRESICCRM